MNPLGQRFEAYARQVTDLPVNWGEAVPAALPAYLAQRYVVHRIQVDGLPMHVVVLKDGEPLPPKALQKQVHQLLALVGAQQGGYCLVAEHLPPYLRRRLVEMRMPFVIPGRQLYWPALGNAETTQRARRLPAAPVEQLAPAAQQLLIMMLLGQLEQPVSVSGAAKALGYTQMSMSRAVKEMESADLISSHVDGRLRTFTLLFSAKGIWDRALPKLRTPVIETVRVMRHELPDAVTVVAGESALAERSNLAEPAEPVYAIASRVWTRQYQNVRTIPTVDEGTCRLELWRYAPEASAKGRFADPLSVYLSLHDHTDERVQQALGAMMERMPW